MKNLSPQASVAQLVALFSRFERTDRPPVLYRVLTGRMKGQAFITLPGEKDKRVRVGWSEGKMICNTARCAAGGVQGDSTQ